jgi:hypothetical protein
VSRVNGDKSRFNRVRKQNIARRNKTRELVKNLTAELKPGPKPGNRGHIALPGQR